MLIIAFRVLKNVYEQPFSNQVVKNSSYTFGVSLLMLFLYLVFVNRWLKAILIQLIFMKWTYNLSAKATRYVRKFWEISITRKSNLNVTRVINNSSFDQCFASGLSFVSKLSGAIYSKKSLLTISFSMFRTLLCKTYF